MAAATTAADSGATHSDITLRTHRPGDMGWITYRHGALYSKEFNYNERFEALVARITADFLDNFDKTKERCWIAERDGEFLGCIMLVKNPEVENGAKLRLLIVEEAARGSGLGYRLSTDAVEFARNAGYRRVDLWTQSHLTGARKIYSKLGFKRIAEEEHDSWGCGPLTGEKWMMDL